METETDTTIRLAEGQGDTVAITSPGQTMFLTSRELCHLVQAAYDQWGICAAPDYGLEAGKAAAR